MLKEHVGKTSKTEKHSLHCTKTRAFVDSINNQVIDKYMIDFRCKNVKLVLKKG